MDYEQLLSRNPFIYRMTNYPKIFSAFKELSWLNPLFSEN